MSNKLKPRSYAITDGPDRAAARTMLMFGDGGLSPEDLDKLHKLQREYNNKLKATKKLYFRRRDRKIDDTE